MIYRNELRVIDNEAKAYLLGFLYGDGTIINHIEKNGRVRFRTKLSINKNDEDLILKLKEIFPFFCIGEFDFGIYNSNSNAQSQISKSSEELYDDLMLNGLFPRKSYENAFRLKLPNIDSNLIHHFIRGFFDADGSVYTQKNRPNLIRIEFCSVSKTFIYELDSYLKGLDINSWEITPVLPKGKSKQIVYKITFTKSKETLKLIDYMYNDSTISLKRKADKCLSYKIINKVLDRNIVCPNCGSNYVTKNGTRNGLKRYTCKDCNRGFTK